MLEFLTMVRGCNLIAEDDILTDSESAFQVRTLQPTFLHTSDTNTPKAFREDNHLLTMTSRIGTSRLNCIHRSDLDIAALSLHDLDILPLSPTERTYRHILLRTIAAAHSNPIETYTTFVLLYNTPSRWTHDEFQAFIDPRNTVAQILLAHFIAVQAILTPILYLERVGFQGVDAPTAVLGWIEGIYRNVPHYLRHHVEWPRQVSRYPFERFMGQRHVPYFDEDPLML